MAKRIFFSIVVVLLCIAVNQFVGLHDWITLVGLAAAALLMQPVVLEFQMGGRVILSNHLKPDGRLHHAVVSPGILAKVIAYFAAFLLAIGFFISLKGMMLSHGAISSLFIVALANFLLFPWLVPANERTLERNRLVPKDETECPENKTSLIVNEFQDSAVKYASFVAGIVAVIFVLNIALAAVLSAKDVGVFMTKDVNLNNFIAEAWGISIAYSGHNEYSRSLINAYILSDHLKLALGNALFDAFFPDAEKVKYFYAFYFATFLMNLVKLMPLSIGFVVFIGGVRRHSDKAQEKFEKTVGKLESQHKKFVIWKALKTEDKKTQQDKNEQS